MPLLQNATWIIAGEKGTATNKTDPEQPGWSVNLLSIDGRTQQQKCGKPITRSDLARAASVGGMNKDRPDGGWTKCIDELERGNSNVDCVIMDGDFEDRLFHDSDCGLNAHKDTGRDADIYCPDGYSQKGFIYEKNSWSSNNNYKICKRNQDYNKETCCWNKDQNTEHGNKCEEGYTYGTTACNDYMKNWCKDGTRIKDEPKCVEYCNDGNGNDTNHCVDAYINYCSRHENRDNDFCKAVCTKAYATDRNKGRNGALRDMCDSSAISYCKRDLKKSFDDGDDKESRFCRGFCEKKDISDDAQTECESMVKGYCESAGPNVDYCRCVKPPDELAPFLRAQGTSGIHCVDGICKSKGFKTKTMKNDKCPACNVTASIYNNLSSRATINQKVICPSGKENDTETPPIPGTPNTPGTPTSGGSGDNGTLTTSSGEENEETTSSGYTKSSGKSTSSGGTESEKGFFDSVDKTTFIIAMVFLGLAILVGLYALFGTSSRRKATRNRFSRNPNQRPFNQRPRNQQPFIQRPPNQRPPNQRPDYV